MHWLSPCWRFFPDSSTAGSFPLRVPTKDFRPPQPGVPPAWSLPQQPLYPTRAGCDGARFNSRSLTPDGAETPGRCSSATWAPPPLRLSVDSLCPFYPLVTFSSIWSSSRMMETIPLTRSSRYRLPKAVLLLMMSFACRCQLSPDRLRRVTFSRVISALILLRHPLPHRCAKGRP